MRSTSSRKSLAIIYVLGLIWLVAMIGGAAVLMNPLLALYETLGIESAAVQMVATMALVITLASFITVGVGLVLRADREPEPVSQRS